VGFAGATSTSVTTENLEGSDNNDKKGFTGVEIAGIVIGSLAVLLILGTGYYFVSQHRVGLMSTAPPSRATPAVELDSHSLEYEDAAAAKARRGPSPAPSAASPARSSTASSQRQDEGGTVNPLASPK